VARKRRGVSELIAAAITLLALTTVAAALMSSLHRAGEALAEEAKVEPPLLQATRYSNGTIVVYNPSSRGVEITALVLGNGSIERLREPLIAPPGEAIVLPQVYNNSVAVVAGHRVYSISPPPNALGGDLPESNSCNGPNLYSVWAIVGLAGYVPLYRINASIFCNASMEKLGYVEFNTIISPLQYNYREEYEYTITICGHGVTGLCQIANGTCQKSVTICSGGPIRAYADLTISSDGSTYNASITLHLTYELNASAYVPLGSMADDGLYGVVEVNYSHNLDSTSAGTPHLSGDYYVTVLYGWNYREAVMYYIKDEATLTASFTVKFASSRQHSSDARGSFYMPVLGFHPCTS
jgi:hypothetical protein